jgi:homogentisate 1,2-dioxygenase
MSEFMGNICGTYDAKEVGFVAGASSLHPCMSGHGPESAVFEKASDSNNKVFKEPLRTSDNSIAFMFETCYMMKLSDHACLKENMDETYVSDSYGDLKKNFNPNQR